HPVQRFGALFGEQAPKRIDPPSAGVNCGFHPGLLPLASLRGAGFRSSLHKQGPFACIDPYSNMSIDRASRHCREKTSGLNSHAQQHSSPVAPYTNIAPDWLPRRELPLPKGGILTGSSGTCESLGYDRTRAPRRYFIAQWQLQCCLIIEQCPTSPPSENLQIPY